MHSVIVEKLGVGKWGPNIELSEKYMIVKDSESIVTIAPV